MTILNFLKKHSPKTHCSIENIYSYRILYINKSENRVLKNDSITICNTLNLNTNFA